MQGHAKPINSTNRFKACKLCIYIPTSQLGDQVRQKNLGQQKNSHHEFLARFQKQVLATFLVKFNGIEGRIFTTTSWPDFGYKILATLLVKFIEIKGSILTSASGPDLWHPRLLQTIMLLNLKAKKSQNTESGKIRNTSSWKNPVIPLICSNLLPFVGFATEKSWGIL